MHPQSRQWRIIALVAAAVAGVLLVLGVQRLRNTPFEWGKFFATLTNVDWGWMGAAVALMLFTYVGRALRWEVMLRPLRPEPDFGGLCSATVIGFTAVLLLGRAGELVRPYLIAIKERVAFSSQMAAWLLERILDTLMVLVIFGFVLLRIPAGSPHLGPGLKWALRAGGYIIAAICLLCGVFLIVFRNFSEGAQTRILSAVTFLPEAYYQRIARTLRAFSEGMQCTRTHASLILLLAYTGLEWAIIVAGYYAVFRAFPATARFDLADVIVFVGFVAIGSIVQIPGIGGGVQIAMVVVLTELFGLSLEVASGLALLIWILSFVVVVPFGLLFAFHEGINWRKFKNLAEDAAA